MNLFHRIVYTLAATLLTLPAGAQFAAPNALITDNTKVQIEGRNGNIEKAVIDVVGSESPDVSMNLAAGNETITVDFSSSPVKLSSTRGLVVYFGRYQDNGNGAPTAVKVSGRPVGSENYEDLGYAYLLYRGAYRTHEFSNRVYSEDDKDYDSFKLHILEVSRGTEAHFYKFNLFAIADGEMYPAGRKDPIHLSSDYYKKRFKNFEYVANNGILDERNHYEPNDTYPIETPWGENNTFLYDGEIHELPTFDKQGGGQMPHVTETTLYAMPGDMISLSPYYDLPTSVNYREKYSHWYQYVPRKNNDNEQLQDQNYAHLKDSEGNRLLDFLIDPSGIVLTDNIGYFAGTNFPRYPLDDRLVEIDGELYFPIHDAASFNDFTNVILNEKQDMNAILIADIDCTGVKMLKIGGEYNGYIDAAFSGKFNGNGHTIKNFTLKENVDQFHAGIFGGIGNGAEIYNLIVEDANITSGGYAGVLVGRLYGSDGEVSIHNVYVKGDVSYTSSHDGGLGTAWQLNIARGAGILGGVEGYNNTIRLENVAFIGSVAGGYGNDTQNAAFVGKPNANKVIIKNCYADALIDHVILNEDNINGYAAIGKNPSSLEVENSYINIRTQSDGLTYNAYQEEFDIPFAGDPIASHIEHTIPTGLIPDAGLLCVEKPDGWDNVGIYAWVEGSNPVEELYGNWPGRKLALGTDDLSFEFWNEDWEKLKYGNVNFIINNFIGDGDVNANEKQQTINLKSSDFFNDESEIYYFSQFEKKGEDEWFTPEVKNEADIFERCVYVSDPDVTTPYYLYADISKGVKVIAPTGRSQDDAGKTFCYFLIPESWGNEVKYGVLKGSDTDIPAITANPLATSDEVDRIFVKFDVDWPNFYCDMWSWPNVIDGGYSREPFGTVYIDGERYVYYDVPHLAGKTNKWGINFNSRVIDNECTSPVNTEKEIMYDSAVRNHQGDMILEVLTAGGYFGDNNRPLRGSENAAIFNPIFFEYGGNVPVVEIEGVEGQIVASTIEVDGEKYYYINLAPTLYDKTQISFDPNETELWDPATSELITDINKYRYGQTDMKLSYALDPAAKFYTGFSNATDVVYLDNREFYTDVLPSIKESSESEWTVADDGVLIPELEEMDVDVTDVDLYSKVFSHDALRWYGTEATFYQPRKSMYAPDDPQNLKLEKPEYHIAADFGHEFKADGDNQYNIDYNNQTIHEPILNFRSVFHIKDGKTFADNYTTSKEVNEKYVTNNSRAVSARAGHDFQVRLSTLVPQFNGSDTYSYAKTNFYYRKADGSYARVPRVGLEITSPDGTVTRSEFRDAPGQNNTQVVSRNIFCFDGSSATQGSRKYPDVENGFCAGTFKEDASYNGGNGDSSVYRTLFCAYNYAKAGTYKVRLIALENDGTTVINTADGAAPLYMDEYVITFVPDSEASVLTELELSDEKYSTHRTEYLESEDVAGAPAVVVDFDQYRTFEVEDLYNDEDYFTYHNPQSDTHRAYKWPMLWQKSTYSYGYGGYYNYDYNEYIIANHTDQVAYHAAADNFVNPDGTSGLYDRLWYDTYDAEEPGNAQMGYFYYVNAASDPGVAARLTINNLCPGSAVAVSAWIAEMSLELEVANLSFNFVAVDEDNNREIVHSFITGYIDNLDYGLHINRDNMPASDKVATSPVMANHGKWVHVYYSFIPDLSSIQNLQSIDHYELELENNCVSSRGADYAVDDIRAYIISPQITARQIQPICDSEYDKIGIMVRSRFDRLLDANGMVEATADNGVKEEELLLHFAVLDKKKYDAEYAEYIALEDSSSEDLAAVVEASVVQMNETTDENVEKTYFTSVYVPNNFEKLDDYDDQKYGEAMAYVGATSRVRYIQTNIMPYDKDLVPGKEYYVVLSTLNTPGYADFAITDDPCAKYAVMTLQGSGVVKIDGIAYRNGEPVNVCIGQSPVVQVDLQMYENDNPDEPVDPIYRKYIDAPTHYYDWYRGSLEEFMTEIEGLNQSCYDLLLKFRENDYYATKLPAVKEGETDEYAPLRELVNEGKLSLHTSSFVFPPLEYPEDKEEHIETLTAVPIIPVPDVEGFIVCSQPNEIRLRVQNNSPLMFDGFTGIDYPAADVPLRLGYNQLLGVETVGALTEYVGEGANGSIIFKKHVVIPENARYIQLPLREAKSYLGDGTRADMTMAGNRNEAADPYVYLAESDDPGYISLDRHPTDPTGIVNSLLPVGMVKFMDASTDKNGTPDDPSYAEIVFSDQMKFREGYYYRLRFAYDEVIPGEVEGYCEGHVVFTLKVVPEYLKWTGGESRNWNNDANWSRVWTGELLTANGNDTAYRDLVTDGKVQAEDEEFVNDNERAFAPLDFTKVIIPDVRKDVADDGSLTSKGYPYMFTAPEQEGGVRTKNGSFPWNNQPAVNADHEGEASAKIEYDMTSMEMDEANMVACRPWYANTCDQIHFNHGAELTHQEHFIFGENYQKAWVDLEMTGGRWYTLSSPLQGVVAGDMYTRSAKARQDTELFRPIEFDNEEYGRFEPAVYQRGWNKAETKTYHIGDESAATSSSAVELNWSRVYNDVDEGYAPGAGFSIRTVTDNIADAETDDDGNAIVLFRLPKADDSYSYFDPADNTEAADDKAVTRVTRNGDDRHSLIRFTDGKFIATAEVGNDGLYFLAGNPFMARMEMSKFLEENSNVIEPVYWIMTDDRQEAALWDEKSGTFISDADSDEVATVAPMQGFFVKAKTQGRSIDLTFTPDMICDDVESGSGVKLRSPRRAERQLLTVTALYAEGDVASKALINIDPAAANECLAEEDVDLLHDRSLRCRPAVYTVADGHALLINSLNDIVETEVGVIAADGVRTTMLFEGVDEADGLLLLDTTTGEMTELTDGMTVEVEGAASGRFYITRKVDDGINELPMTMVIKGRTVSIVSPEEGIIARVYTPEGMLRGEWSTGETLLHIDLEPGISIVEAVSGDGRVVRKYVVR